MRSLCGADTMYKPPIIRMYEREQNENDPTYGLMDGAC